MITAAGTTRECSWPKYQDKEQKLQWGQLYVRVTDVCNTRRCNTSTVGVYSAPVATDQRGSTLMALLGIRKLMTCDMKATED